MPPYPFSSLLLSPPHTATHNRRSLQQSFFLQNSSPPTDQPSTETSFFPSIASPPPPPSTPSPPAYVSFFSTAQTSKSSTLSTNLLAVGLLVFAAAVAALVIVLCVRRMLWRSLSNCKTNRASYSKGVSQLNGLPKPGRSPVPNFEFLYAGTIADSHGGASPHVSPSSGGDVSLRKLDSPELHPLTPLGQRNSRNCYANAVVSSHREVEEGEFYSAMESLRALESSVENRSAGRRDFAAAAAENVDARSSGASYSSSSHSLSNWGSPTRSVSLSTSSPTRSVSLSTSSPELMAVQSALPPPLRPQPRVMAEFANMNTTPSPSPSYSSSPERDSEESLASSPRSNISLTNADSSMKIYSVFWSALYCSKDSPSRSFSWETPVENCESPAPISNVGFNQFPNKRNSQSPPVFSSFSPPERPSGKNPSHPNMESQARFETMFLKPVSVSVAPQPPRPPPPGGHGERLVSTPSRSQPTLNPPVLITPSRPGTLHRPTLISPTVLPHNSESLGNSEETQKPMLKPLHWDKVRASSAGEMVWDQLKPRLKEDQTFFVPDTRNSNWKEPVLSSPNQENRVLHPKKAQNIAISLRALNITTDEVCEALSEGNADALGTVLLENLLKMTPTKEEERRLKEHKDNSPFKLGPAERFLKAVLDIPFAFKRVGAMLYIANFKSEVEYLKKTFDILEAACEELRSSRMFLKLLEAVLKTGNHMNIGTNRGDAHAFKLDTLLKFVDVKGANGKTTLLHFVVLETIRTERFSGGNQNRNITLDDDARRRKLALQIISSLSSELRNVMKAAAMDSDMLVCNVMKLSRGIETIAEIVPLNEEMGLRKSIGKFSESMKRFTRTAEEEITRIRVQESVSLSLVKEIIEYFQGDSAKEEAHPFRIFMLVRDFVTILDGVCKEVRILNEQTVTGIGSAHKFPIPVNPTLQPVKSGFPRGRNYRYFYDESSSPL